MIYEIGMKVAKPFWREHYLEVADVGSFWFVARVRNQNTNECVASGIYEKSDPEYVEYVSAEDTINRIRVKK